MINIYIRDPGKFC